MKLIRSRFLITFFLLAFTGIAYASLSCEFCFTNWICEESDTGGTNYVWTAPLGGTLSSGSFPYVKTYDCPSTGPGQVNVDFDIGPVHYSDSVWRAQCKSNE